MYSAHEFRKENRRKKIEINLLVVVLHESAVPVLDLYGFVFVFRGEQLDHTAALCSYSPLIY